MFTGLIESQRARERSAFGTAASVAAHVVVIAGVTWATLGAAAVRHEPDLAPTIIYTPLDPTPVHRGGVPAHTPPAPCVDCTPLPYPLPTPTTTPGTDTPPDMPPIDFPVGTPGDGAGKGPGTGEGGCVDCVYETADELAHPFRDNAPPVYPAMMRNLRVAGSVAARFVVDTLGRVEPASVTFESGGDELFEASARRALLTWRFIPAATNGHRVRILVRQEFSFRLTP
jgi:TonB family protein